jgi:hypothetical protein
MQSSMVENTHAEKNMGHSIARFPHRLLNGVYESICPICFRTVASDSDEEQLVYAEIQHCCDPKDLEKYEALRKPDPDSQQHRVVTRGHAASLLSD